MTPDQVTKLLDDLTARFGPAAQQLYELAVRQATIEGIVNIVVGLVLILGPLAVYLRWARWALNGGIDVEPGLLVALFGALVTVPVLFGGSLLYGGVLWLLNPQWRAIEVLGRLLPK